MSVKTRTVQIPNKLVEQGNITVLKERPEIKEGAVLLKKGEVVAFPTETVYGLGADATNSSAVAKIFKAKGRPQDNPLIVHIGSRDQLDQLVKGEISEDVESLVKAFWPGPLTVILPKNNTIPERTTAGLNTVGIRMPSHPVALALIQAVGSPLAAPSANSSGYPSPTRAEHVLDDLSGLIPYIIDGGGCEVGVESTVILVGGNQPTILRPGGITREEIERVLEKRVLMSGDHSNDESKISTPISPGVKYRHYSPSTPVKLVEPINRENIDNFLGIIEEAEDEKLGLVLTRESKLILEKKLSKRLNLSEKVKLIAMGSRQNPEQIAQNIFAILRELDNKDNELIIVESVIEAGLGEAIMNRLHKAAADYIYFN